MTVVGGEARGTGASGPGAWLAAAQVAADGAVLVAPPKRRSFPGQPEQVAAARRFVARALDGCPDIDTAILLASELITNALQHTGSAGRGTFEVIVWRGRSAACVAVLDRGSTSKPARPALEPGRAEPGRGAEVDDLAESGYGLALVDTLATRWGYRALDEGMAVWFLLRWRTS